MPEYAGTRMKGWKNYKIKPRQESNAKKLGVIIKPSSNKLKKLDVFEKSPDGKAGDLLAQIGGRYQDGVWYGDYASYKEKPKDRYGNDIDADERRLLYLKRHSHESKWTKGTKKNQKRGPEFRSPSYWADEILWQ